MAYGEAFITGIRIRRDVSKPLWNALAASTEPATIADLHRATRARPNSIQLRLRSWTRAGHVIVNPGKPNRFVMTDPARQMKSPPSLRVDGTPTKPAQGRKRMWTAMRVLRRFDLPTLIMTAEVSRRSAEDYINCLMRAGMLVRTTRGNPTTKSWSTYALAGSFGPATPVVRHRAGPSGRTREVYDPNTRLTHDISPRIRGMKATSVIIDEAASLFFEGNN